jgi:ABC-type transport system involved in multi-copper enzyme maturation permease subunit
MPVRGKRLVEWLSRRVAWSNSRESWQERIGIGLLLIGTLAVGWFRDRLSLGEEVLTWTLLAVCAAILTRRGWLRLFGPILFYDLVRSARQRRYLLLRALYGGFLALLLFWVYLTWHLRPSGGAFTTKTMTDFAEQFFYSFIVVQVVTVILLTPAYTAGAIADEKDRKTLEFVLATDLRDREIVLGKFASRVANLTLVLLIGLPILSALQFLGGIDPNLLLAGFAATGLTMFSLAALSLLNSVLTKKARDAIAATYLLILAYFILSTMAWFVLRPIGAVNNFPSSPAWTSPVTAGDLIEALAAGNPLIALIEMASSVASGAALTSVLPGLLRNYAIFHCLLTVICLVWSVLRLRAVAIKQAYGTTQKAARRRRLLPRPSIGPYPMLWKEVFAEAAIRTNAVGRVVLVLLIAGSFVPVGLIMGSYEFYWATFSWSEAVQGVNMWIRILGTMVACLMLLAVAARASSSISGERDRQTLDSLLVTPLRYDAILFAKWFGNIVSLRWGWLWLGSIYGFGLCIGALHPSAFAILCVAWLVYAAVLSGMGIWFSLVCATTLRSTICTLLSAAGAGLGPLFLLMCCTAPIFWRSGQNMEVLFKFQYALSPPVALGYAFPFTLREVNNPGGTEDVFGYALVALWVWALVAVVFWRTTSARFRRLANPVRRERRVLRTVDERRSFCVRSSPVSDKDTAVL